MENPNNISAVEWLIEKIETLIKNGYAFNPKFEEDLIDQAKEIFKQQIIDAGNTCAFKQVVHSRKVDLMTLEELEQYAKEEAINVGEEYYNEKFKNK